MRELRAVHPKRRPPGILAELAADGAQLWPWTVEQYHLLIKNGILPEGEPYELLGGQLVRKNRSASGADPMTIGPEHAWAVKSLAKLGDKLRRLGCHIQTQQPITLPPFDEPEPDAAIVLGSEDDFRGRHPGAADLTCVIEVSDASLDHDRNFKRGIYASAGVERYFIINLTDRAVEAYADPMPGKGTYGKLVTLAPADRLELPAGRGKKLVVPVNQLLPR